MAQFLGSDVGELRGFAKDISSAADDLDLVSKKLTQLIVQNRGWQGPDAQRFTSQWHGRNRPTLAKVVQGLLTTSRELRVQADEQERTSLAADITSLGGATSPDHSSSRYPDRGSADLSEQALADLKGLVDKAADTDNIFRGNDADIEKLRKALDELTPAELDQLLASLSDQDLNALGQALAKDGKGIFNWEGTTPFERQMLLEKILSKASPEQVARIKEQIPWVQPNAVAQGDAARPGGANSDDSNEWMNPSGPVVGAHPGKDDISQGGYGDCVVMAGLGTIVDRDPNWVRDHVVDNGNGTVSVQLYDKNGNPQWVSVTNDLPAADGGAQKGAQPGVNGNWPAYVEKALVQVYGEDDSNDGTNSHGVKDKIYGPGEYRAIEGNYGKDALSYLSGDDISTITSSQQLWSAVENGQPAIVTTKSELPDGAPDGYVAGHAFFVDGMDAEGNIILQNPWGPDRPKVHMSPKQFEEMFGNASIVAP